MLIGNIEVQICYCVFSQVHDDESCGFGKEVVEYMEAIVKGVCVKALQPGVSLRAKTESAGICVVFNTDFGENIWFGKVNGIFRHVFNNATRDFARVQWYHTVRTLKGSVFLLSALDHDMNLFSNIYIVEWNKPVDDADDALVELEQVKCSVMWLRTEASISCYYAVPYVRLYDI